MPLLQYIKSACFISIQMKQIQIVIQMLKMVHSAFVDNFFFSKFQPKGICRNLDGSEMPP